MPIRMYYGPDNDVGCPATCCCGAPYRKPDVPCHVPCDCGHPLEDADQPCPNCDRGTEEDRQNE